MKTEAKIEPKFVRPAGAARYVSMSRRHLFDLTQQGLFACHRIGRRCVLYSLADLDAGMARLRRGAVGER